MAFPQQNGPFYPNMNGPPVTGVPRSQQPSVFSAPSANVWSSAGPSRFPTQDTQQYPQQFPPTTFAPQQRFSATSTTGFSTPVQTPYQNGAEQHQLNVQPHVPPSQSTMKLDATEGQYTPSSSVPPAPVMQAQSFSAPAPSLQQQHFPAQPASPASAFQTRPSLTQTFAPNIPPAAPAPDYQQPPLAPSGYPQPSPALGYQPPPPATSYQQPPPPATSYQQPPPGPGYAQQQSHQMGNGAPSQPSPTMSGQAQQGPTQSFAPQPPNSLGPHYPPLSAPPGSTRTPSTPDPLSLSAGFQRLSVQGGAASSDQMSPVNILQFSSPADTRLLPPEGVHTEHVRPPLSNDLRRVNVSPDVVRCTLNCIPQTEQLLKKSRLPLALVLHPYKDLQSLALIQSSVIVRCKTCRAYINPFIQFLDQCHYWRCNICGRTNEVPDDFFYDPVNRSQGSPMNRPEVKSATIEFIAPQEYCVRPPQPAVFAFLFDVSATALQTGYLSVVCDEVKALLDRLPGDKRRQMAFIAFDSMLHVFNLDAEMLSQPKMMTLTELDETYLPEPDGLLVNFEDNREMISTLLENLPYTFGQTGTTEGSAAGAALLLAQKLLMQTGGRITLFMAQRTTHGPGELEDREPPTSSPQNTKQTQTLITEATDFYKKFALDCNSQQIGCDLFLMSRTYADLATLSGAPKFSAGSVYFFPGFDVAKNPLQLERFRRQLHRYLLRKIGFEAVLRIRCAKGLALNSFYGNFFVRSTDLLSLANVNPDAGYAVTLAYEDSLADQPTVCFQIAILYTSSKSERRIRVHTMCLPTTNQLTDVFRYADELAVTSLLAKLAVDRSLSDSVTDAREALLSACVDPLASFAGTLSSPNRSDVLLLPYSLRLMPMLTLALLKHPAFSTDGFIRADDRIYSMEQCRNLPPAQLILKIYPNLYNLNVPLEQNATWKSFPLLRLSSSSIQRHGLYLLDSFDIMLIFVCNGISDQFVQSIFDVPNFNQIVDGSLELPNLQNDHSRLIRELIDHNNSQRPVPAVLFVIKDNSVNKAAFMRRLVEDKSESGASTGEFLQYIQKELAK